MTARWVIAADIGGSGSRIARKPVGDSSASAEVLVGPRVRISAVGSAAGETLRELIALAHSAWPEVTSRVGGVALGVTGLATLVRDPAQIHAVLAEAFPGVPRVLAADGVTAHVGALGGAPGAVVAAGTGTIAIGTDFTTTWTRVDGWGHLLGDDGGGASIGEAGLRAAVSQYDGRRSRGSAALLERALSRFGQPETWPSQFYTREDRAGVLATFAIDVAESAREGDSRAIRILRDAGRSLAVTLAAAVVDDVPPLVSYCGGVFDIDGQLLSAFQDELQRGAPHLELRKPLGTPLSGALRMAAIVAAEPGRFAIRAPYIV